MLPNFWKEILKIFFSAIFLNHFLGYDLFVTEVLQPDFQEGFSVYNKSISI